MQYAKALVAAVIAALTSLVGALDDDAVSSGEGASIALAFFVALGAVWAVPNMKPGERGQSSVVTALLVIALLLIILVLVGHPVRIG